MIEHKKHYSLLKKRWSTWKPQHCLFSIWNAYAKLVQKYASLILMLRNLMSRLFTYLNLNVFLFLSDQWIDRGIRRWHHHVWAPAWDVIVWAARLPIKDGWQGVDGSLLSSWIWAHCSVYHRYTCILFKAHVLKI